MDKLGLTCNDMTETGWKLAADLASYLEDEPDKSKILVVIQPFDNRVYYGTGPNGEKTSPVKHDSKWHIVGALQTASKRELQDLMCTAMPILRATKGVPMVLLSLLLQYIVRPCCGDTSHLCDLASDEFRANRYTNTADMFEQLDSMCHMRKLKHITVRNPAPYMKVVLEFNLEGKQKMKLVKNIVKLWGKDPIHPTSAAYNNLARELLNDYPTFLGALEKSKPSEAREIEIISNATSAGPSKKKKLH